MKFFAVAIATLLAPALQPARASDTPAPEGIEYVTSIIAPVTKTLCDQLVAGYGSRFDAAYRGWHHLNQHKISTGRLVIAKKLGPTRSIERYEEIMREKIASDFIASERSCNETIALLQPPPLPIPASSSEAVAAAANDLQLACSLKTVNGTRTTDFIVAVDLDNDTVLINSHLKRSATILDSLIYWELPMDDEIVRFSINRYTGTASISNRDKFEVSSGNCTKAARRRF